jgi:putative membrane protein
MMALLLSPLSLLLCLLPGTSYAHVVDGEQAALAHGVLWNWDPLVLALLAMSGALYAAGLARLWRNATWGSGIRTWQAMSFYGGWVTLIVALVSPIDTLGLVLFSAHMVQHELLMLVAAPLMVLGKPLVVFMWSFPPQGRRRLGGGVHAMRLTGIWHWLTRPLAAWMLHAFVLWIWHAPPLFEESLRNEAVHTLQHTSFFIVALLFWWSLLQEKQSRGTGIIYLLTTAMHTGALGALLSYSSQVWYPLYGEGPATWGLTALEDQQLGGLIMWVPGGLAYLLAALWLGSNLLNSDEKDRLASR